MLYPRMSLSELVGTDLVQAVPLVASAAIGHLLFGNFKLGLTVSILIGSLPGVFIGARFSSRAPDYVIRPSLSVVLLLSGMKLVGASNLLLALVAPLAVAVGFAYALSAGRRARRERATQVTEIELVNGTSSGPVPAVAAVPRIRTAEHRRS
jgi:hypothetical protein